MPAGPERTLGPAWSRSGERPLTLPEAREPCADPGRTAWRTGAGRDLPAAAPPILNRTLLERARRRCTFGGEHLPGPLAAWLPSMTAGSGNRHRGRPGRTHYTPGRPHKLRPPFWSAALHLIAAIRSWRADPTGKRAQTARRRVRRVQRPRTDTRDRKHTTVLTWGPHVS
ncbi:hypothetical protein NDU88_004160 [Pleurodeles waltl]|uniref:Uncharacterized protein n=1 Tax=Pleurodeles waltl TaxID=8319 RepID=A0AAV7VJ11_PLEWA|nr:hypothetical protein NDU88_004160 [Pleurodeles waltl]